MIVRTPGRVPAKPVLFAAAVLAALPLVAGCSLLGGGKKPSDTAYVARDVNTLYALAKSRLDRGDYAQAAKIFDEVERQHPYSVWARRAQLMSAFSYYMAKTYPDAISSAQRFLTIHPGNKDAPYANYLIAMSYYNQIGDVTRDHELALLKDRHLIAEVVELAQDVRGDQHGDAARARVCDRIARRSLRPRGSSPSAGSSRISRRGPCRRQRAISRR